jgi:hypothetical protein
MNIIDLPQTATHALYDDAITRYAELVRARSIAVYRLGTIEHPGLSDIRLLVVMNRTGIDNRYYFSALHRLPARFRRLFVQEPFILPAWSMRVVQYTAHESRALLAGRDVLHSYASHSGCDEDWCRVLESYCSYAAFIGRIAESGTLQGRLALSLADRFRYVLCAAARLPIGVDAKRYQERWETIRATVFECDTTGAVEDAWKLLTQAFGDLHKLITAWSGVDDENATLGRARTLLRGEESCEAFDREYAFRRARDIDGYHQELASLGFPYGHLFFAAAHPGASRAPLQTPVVSNFVRNIYRVRRRITEYAARH